MRSGFTRDVGATPRRVIPEGLVVGSENSLVVLEIGILLYAGDALARRGATALVVLEIFDDPGVGVVARRGPALLLPIASISRGAWQGGRRKRLGEKDGTRYVQCLRPQTHGVPELLAEQRL